MPGDVTLRAKVGPSSKVQLVAVTSSDPDQLKVSWPKKVVGKFIAKVRIMSGGKLWKQPTKLELQVRPSGESGWLTVAKRSTKSGKSKLATTTLKTGTWRVVAPQYDLDSARVYGAQRTAVDSPAAEV